MTFTNYRSLNSFRSNAKIFAGRNNQGVITVRHRGGGHKQAYRKLDWSRFYKTGIIVAFEYDPQRSAPIAKLFHSETNEYSYILAPAGVSIFSEITSYTKTDSALKLLRTGDSAPISFFETGDFIHAVESFSGQGSVFSRSAGTYCQILSFEQNVINYTITKNQNLFAKIRLPSGSQRLINFDSHATLGTVAIAPLNTKNLGKAGRTRWLGWRPKVRGVAMNPVDHPHGGGQGKTSGGRPSVTFNSWPTKGKPTRSKRRKSRFIILQPKK